MLENPTINIKIKLAALWTSVMFCYVYGDYFELYVPEKISGILAGEQILDSPTKLFIAAIVMAIPSVMIALSVLLKPKINRILNIVFGVIFTAMMLLIAITSLSAWHGFYVFLAILESIITFSIVVLAFKWPRTTNE